MVSISGRENPVLCREPHFHGRRDRKQVKVLQIPMTKADLFLRIFEAIPGTLKCPSLRSLSTCWQLRDSTVCTAVYVFFCKFVILPHDSVLIYI